MSYEEYGDVTRLDGFDVVAIDGEGVYVVDSGGRCWCLAGSDYLQAAGGELAAAYAEATR